MRIEGGSQNASRTPGVYAYPLHRYNPDPVEGIAAIRRSTNRPFQSDSAAGRTENDFRVETARKSGWSDDLKLTYEPGQSVKNRSTAQEGRGSRFDIFA